MTHISKKSCSTSVLGQILW